MDNNSEKSKLPQWLLHAPLIDTFEGLNNCGTAEAYMSAIDIFIEHVSENIKEMDSYFEADDLMSYTVRAHALKSTSRIIGAMVLSSLAAAMERAGEENNLQFVHDVHPAFIGLYRRYEQLFLDNLEQKKKKELPEGQMEDAILAMKEYAAAEDFSLLDGAFELLADYELPEGKEEMILELKRSLVKLDWDRIRSILEMQ